MKKTLIHLLVIALTVVSAEQAFAKDGAKKVPLSRSGGNKLEMTVSKDKSVATSETEGEEARAMISPKELEKDKTSIDDTKKTRKIPLSRSGGPNLSIKVKD